MPPILIGSHVDSVPDGGNYDGPVGSFSAIEVARTLTEREISLRHPLEVVVFQNEEGGTVGSKAMIGALTDADLDHTARSGRTIRDGFGVIGGDVARLAEAVRKTGDLTCYLELHIEQGGTLDSLLGTFDNGFSPLDLSDDDPAPGEVASLDGQDISKGRGAGDMTAMESFTK